MGFADFRFCVSGFCVYRFGFGWLVLCLTICFALLGCGYLFGFCGVWVEFGVCGLDAVGFVVCCNELVAFAMRALVYDFVSLLVVCGLDCYAVIFHVPGVLWLFVLVLVLICCFYGLLGLV